MFQENEFTMVVFILIFYYYPKAIFEPMIPEDLDLIEVDRCPRCGCENLIMYGETFDCTDCQMEFETIDVARFEEEDILSIEEKKHIRPKVWSRWLED